MNSFLKYLLISIFFISLSANDELLYKNGNSWLNIYANIQKNQILDEKIKKLEDEIQKAPKDKKQELVQHLELLKNQKSILDELPKSFNTILENIASNKKEKSVNLIEYLFHNRLKDFKIQTKKLSIIRDEYNEAVYHIKEQLKSIDDKNSSQTYQLKKALYYFEDAKELIANKEDVLKHQQKIYQKELKNYEKTQLQSHLINVGVIIFIFIIFESLKRFITNKIEDEERYFKVKKILNITFFLLMLMVFIIFNIDNIIYAATLIGFIAAAITISLKEYLQSFVAWFYLSFGNFIKTGDRILIHINNVDIIGEVINISPFKITLYESINNTTSVHLKRAGRIVFIPNNYFVTNYVYNYTHDKMKTIYDLVEFKIPFDEDIEKIEEISYEVALSVSEKYMEVASKQFLRLKQRYDMRSRDFRPRIHLIPHQSDSCFTLYIWYVTPYHLVMELKSQLSQKIVQRFKDEDIKFYKTNK